jgi:hypothetical protein
MILQMTVFKYLEDKDVFQKFYSKMLARRLIFATSASDDHEANMITRLKEACGTDYTTKLQKMFQDMTLCKDLNEGFKEHTSHLAEDEGSSKKDDSTHKPALLFMMPRLISASSISGLPRIGSWYIIVAVVGPSYRHDASGRIPENNGTIQTILFKEAFRSPPDLVVEPVEERTPLDVDVTQVHVHGQLIPGRHTFAIQCRVRFLVFRRPHSGHLDQRRPTQSPTRYDGQAQSTDKG